MIHLYGTIGPSCRTQEVFESMIREGMHGIRLNLSHASLDLSAPVIQEYASACLHLDVPPMLMIDLHGPEQRIGRLSCPLELSEGDHVELHAEDGITGVSPVSVSRDLYEAIEQEDRILIQDGTIQLKVLHSSHAGRTAECAVLRGGLLSSFQSINIEGKEIYGPVLTDDDLHNLDLAEQMGVTSIMQPFVRDGNDLRMVRQALEARKLHAQIFAKIESGEGIANLDSILQEADVVVIARGDLGNAMPLWELPAAQKEIAARCRNACKPFMVVTQMLHSMTLSPIPTRAEVLDIFNAVLDGASYLMVTGETSVGRYPAEVIRYLRKTAQEAENYLHRLS